MIASGLRAATAQRADNVLIIGPWPDGDPPEIFTGCTLVFLIPWPGFALDYAAWGRRLHAAGIGYALVLPHPAATRCTADTDPIAVGAYFSAEDHTPCWRCLELRMLGWTRDATRDAAFLETLKGQGPQEPGGYAPPTEEQIVMLKWLAMDITGADPGVAVHGTHDGSFTLHFFLPHPQCAFCSPWAGAPTGDGATPLEWLTDVRFGTLRPRRPDPAATLLPPRLRYEVCGPTPSFGADSLPGLAPSYGHDVRESDEQVALLEGIAAYTTALRAGRPMWRGTRRGIPASALDPSPWIPYENAHGLIPHDESREYDWQRAHRLERGDDVSAPADLFFTGRPWERLMHAEPAATVAHPNIEVAVRVSLTRVAAVDGLMVAWYASLVPPRVMRSELTDEQDELLAQLEALDWEMAVVDLTADLGVPVVAVLGRTPWRWCWGCGADLDPRVGLQRAFHAFTDRLCQPEIPVPGGLDFLFEGAAAELPPAHPEAHRNPLDTWRAYLRRAGLEAFWADVTPPDVARTGVVVVRTLIAEALPTIREEIGGRPVSRRLRRRDSRPLRREALNPRPHPFS